VQVDCFFIGRLSGSKGSVRQDTAIDVGLRLRLVRARANYRRLLHRLAHELALVGRRLKAVSTDQFVSGESRSAVESHGARQHRIKAGRPTSNGCVERVQLTFLEERWRPSFARSLVPRITALRWDLDTPAD